MPLACSLKDYVVGWGVDVGEMVVMQAVEVINLQNTCTEGYSS